METNEPGMINEDQSPETTAPKDASAPKKRGFWRRTRQIAAWVILFLLFFSTAGLLFIQLPIFKRLVVSQITGIVEKNTNGTLVIGDIQGNLLEGFVLNNVTLRLKTGTSYDTIPLVHADKIIARYSILRYLRTNEIGVSSLVVLNPVIRLVKFVGDTTWNYMRFGKSSSTPAPKFSQIFDIASLRIQNGSFYSRDYNDTSGQNRPNVVLITKESPSESDIQWSDLQVESIDLDSKFYIHGAAQQTATVNQLRFFEKKSGFSLQHLELSGTLDSATGKIDNAKIVTAHSSIAFSAQLAKPGEIGTIGAMQHSLVDLKLNSPVVNTTELKKFSPDALSFLSGSPGLILDIDGEFGKLRIKRLNLDFKGQGSISIAGTMKNLHHPDSLSMDLNLQAHELSNTTLADYVPGLHLPDLSRFGKMNISNLSYNGEPLNFRTIFAAHSSGAGDVSGNVVLDLRNHNFKYTAGVKTDHFNIAALNNRPDFESSITAEARLAGNGTNWKTLSNVTVIKTDAPSKFGKYSVSSLDLSAAMKRGTISADHLDALVDGGPEVHVRSAKVDLLAENIPFQFDGAVDSFPLAQILKNQPNNPSRADLVATIEGTAKNFNDLTGKIHVRLFDLEYQSHKLDDLTADASLSDGRSSDNNLSVQSTMADLTIEHRFNLGDLIHALPEHVSALITAIGNRDFPPAGTKSISISSCADSMDFDYLLKIKDLRPLAEFLPRTFLLAQGDISGSVSGCPNGNIDIAMSGDSLAFVLRNRTSIDTSLLVEGDSVVRIDTLVQLPNSLPPDSSKSIALENKRTLKTVLVRNKRIIRDTIRSPIELPQFGEGIPRIQATPTKFSLSMRNISNDPKQVLGNLEASLDFATDSVVRLGTSLLYHPKFGLSFKNEELTFDVATVYNNALRIRLKGDTHFPDGNLDFVLDTMRIEYANPYYKPGLNELKNFIWLNENPGHIILAKNGLITIDTLSIIHPIMNSESRSYAGAQRMSFGGTLIGDTINAWAAFPSFRLEEYDKIIPISPSAKSNGIAKFNGKVRNVNVTLNGTLERPIISASLFADSLTYGDFPNQIEFDSNAVNLKYNDRVLSGNLILHAVSVPTGDKIAKISDLRASLDSIPMVISLKHGPEYASDSASVLTRPISANINTSNFPLDIVTPFIPPFSKLQGTGDIHFSVTGTRQNIQYTGLATVHNAAFLLAATNIWYLFDGPLSFADNSLKLQNIVIHNVDADDPLGQADVSGFFNFKGFSITNFDLELHSNRLMVLSTASRQSLGFVYGPVTINTSGSNFHFHNTFDAPKIDGNINIMSANITFPGTNGVSQSVSNEGIIYRAEPDDSIVKIPSGGAGQIAQDAALDSAIGAGSVKMISIDDSLFPNKMKDVYLNDDGTIANSDTSAAPAEANSALAPGFADKLRMDMRVNTEGEATILFPFSGLSGILGAQLNAELKRGGSLKIERGDELGSSSTIGEFELSQNSTFAFYKTFNITDGTITFLNDLTNPQIYITAEYIGTHASDAPAEAKIDLAITGTADHPAISAQNYVQVSGTGQFEPVPEASAQGGLEDAIYFLASGGYFKYETTQEKAIGVLALSNAGTSIGSSLGSDILSSIVGSTGSAFALKSASFSSGSYGLAAQYKSIQFKASENTTLQQTDILIDIPLSELIPGNASRNFLIELQYNEASGAASNTLIQQPLYLSKLVWAGYQW